MIVVPANGTYDDQPEDTDGESRRTRRSYPEFLRLGAVIAAERARRKPKTWKALAIEHAVSERTLRDIYRRYREREIESPLHTTSREVDDVFREMELSTERLREMAISGDNSSARLGAEKQLLVVRRSRLELLVATGRVVSNPKVVADAELHRQLLLTWMDRVFALAEETNVSAEFVDGLTDIFDELCRLAIGDAAVPTHRGNSNGSTWQ